MMSLCWLETPKECVQCRIVKPIWEFHRDARELCGYRRKCKDCTNLNQAEPARLRYRFWRGQVMLHHGGEYPHCVDCGFSDPWGLQFGHRQNIGAVRADAQGTGTTYLKYLLSLPPGEILVVCANCNWIQYQESVEPAKRLTNKAWARDWRCVVDHYSDGHRRCGCCHYADLRSLTIDHFNNDGSFERRTLNGQHAVLNKIVAEGFPPTYGVMCRTCNHGRYLAGGGCCPHKQRIDAHGGARDNGLVLIES
jgi:hypothetical protein